MILIIDIAIFILYFFHKIKKTTFSSGF